LSFDENISEVIIFSSFLIHSNLHEMKIHPIYFLNAFYYLIVNYSSLHVYFLFEILNQILNAK